MNCAASGLHFSQLVSFLRSPDDTVWEGGTFNLVIEFTEDYPNKAPKVRFVSKLWHPNVYADGA